MDFRPRLGKGTVDFLILETMNDHAWHATRATHRDVQGPRLTLGLISL
jgi:hypothetical protein